MASRNTRSASRALSAPEPAPATGQDDGTVDNVNLLAPTRRSQRLIARRARQAQEPQHSDSDDEPQPARTRRSRSRRRASATGKAAPTSSAAAPAGAAVPQRPAGLRRAAAGRREPARPPKRVRGEPQLTGLFDTLPSELVDLVIDACDPRQLARLEATCSYFKSTKKLDTICFDRLKAVPRAKGMEPNRMVGESWASTLFFITSQSNAAAQATALSMGNTHSAALLVPTSDDSDGNHNMYTFGRGFHGALGHAVDHDNYQDVLEPEPLCIGYQSCSEYANTEEEITAAVVACGNSHSACITRRGMLYTYGLGNRGELGLGPINAGEAWFPERAILSNKPHLRIVSLACGTNHTLAISEIGTLWACGVNNKGQLGIGNREDCAELRPLFGSLRGYRIVAAAAGQHHSMALSSDGSLFTWGCGSEGQLGHPSMHAFHLVAAGGQFVVDTPRKIDSLDPFRLQPWKRVTAISSGKNHCMAVTVCGELLGFGRNKSGELGVGHRGICWSPTFIPVSWTGESSIYYRTSQVACGASHTIALVMYRGKLIPCATGANNFGQLGLGDQQNRTRFAPIMQLASADVVTLQAGDHSSGAICADGTVYLWGRNDHGQLGLGHDRSPWMPVALPGFRAVHPDRTLRKNKRSLPRMRVITQDLPAAADTSGKAGPLAERAAAFFLPANSQQQPPRQNDAKDTQATPKGPQDKENAPPAGDPSDKTTAEQPLPPAADPVSSKILTAANAAS